MLRTVCPTPVNVMLPRPCDVDRIAFWLDDIFDDLECENLCKAAETNASFEPLIQARCTSYRGRYRDMRLAVDLFKRIAPSLPNTFKGGTLRKLQRDFEANKFHSSDSTPIGTRSGELQSGYSGALKVQLYLSTAGKGGGTRFMTDINPDAPYVECEAKRGRVLVFEPGLLHQEALVEAGIKYTLTTNAIFDSTNADDTKA